MKIYTGGGDRGKTSLFSGERITKSDPRIEAFGDVDELNATLGMLAASLPGQRTPLIDDIYRIQSDLFHIGAWLATTAGAANITVLQAIGDDHINFLESAIDHMQEALPALSGFILPGGHMAAAMAHVARAVCRRTERHVVKLFEAFSPSPLPESLQHLLIYLNRLSDYLFVLARYSNKNMGIKDTLWKK
jgi:cob(I)alamin adenosyltransferase